MHMSLGEWLICTRVELHENRLDFRIPFYRKKELTWNQMVVYDENETKWLYALENETKGF